MGEAKARKAAAERARLERKLPENLSLLHDGELNYRAETVKAIEADPDMMDHIELLESVMDYIHVFVLRPPKDLDNETVQLLATRMFNDLAAAYGQLTRGYYQIAAMILRDVMEIVFLLGLFIHKPDQIKVWRESDHKTRRDLFSPVKVRDFLNSFPGYSEKRRDAAYRMFCEYAAHATQAGFALMGPSGGKPTIGPFFDSGLLKAILEELAQLAAQAGANAGHWFDADNDLQALATQLRRIEVSATWLERFYGRKTDQESIDELKRALAEMTSQG
jgi:hypothetical protein